MGNKLQEVIKKSVELAGEYGGAITSLFNPVVGVAIQLSAKSASLSLNNLFTNVGEEFNNRVLTNLEHKRVGLVYTFAILGIIKRLENDEVFNDYFRLSEKSTKKEAMGLLEDLFIKVKNDYDDKKSEYYAKLMENICFEPNLEPDEAHYLLKLFESLSFRQLTILKIVSQPDIFPLFESKEEIDSTVKNENNILSNSYQFRKIVTNVPKTVKFSETNGKKKDIVNEFKELISLGLLEDGVIGISLSNIKLTDYGTKFLNITGLFLIKNYDEYTVRIFEKIRGYEIY